MACNISATVTPIQQITATVTIGGKPYQRGTIVIPAPTTIVQDDFLIGKTIDAIIWVGGQSIDWELQGITFDGETGTFDATNYGELAGTLRYWYK